MTIIRLGVEVIKQSGVIFAGLLGLKQASTIDNLTADQSSHGTLINKLLSPITITATVVVIYLLNKGK